MSVSAAALVIGSVGLVVLGVEPVLLSGLLLADRLDQAVLGWIVGSEISAIACGTVAGVAALKRMDARLIGLFGVALVVTANLFALDENVRNLALLASRCLAGVGEGLMVSLASVVIARARRPTRFAAIFLAIQTLMQLVLVVALSLLPAERQVEVAFGGMAGLAVLAAGLSILLPRAMTPVISSSKPSRPTGRGLLGLIAAGGFLGGVVAIWGYMGLWAMTAGGSRSDAAMGVAVSLGFQLSGAVAAGAFDRLSGRKMLAAILVLELSIVAILLSPAKGGGLVYGISAVFGFLWQFAMPAFIGLQARIDPERGSLPYVGSAQLCGSALIPPLAALSAGASGLPGVLWLTGGVFAAVLLLVLIVPQGEAKDQATA